MNSSRRRLDAQSEKYSHISTNGLRVTKRTSQAVTLAWPENESDVVTFTDSKVSCLDMETELDSQGNWFVVQMRKMDDDALVWETVYKGYGLRCDVDGLDPDSLILFRMKRNGDKNWGTEIIASTDPPQASGEDLSRAVEMNSEYLVTRILGNTPRNTLKRILAAHDKNGKTSLMIACHNGNHTIAKMLLSCGSGVNDVSSGVKRTPLMFACIIGKLNIVQLLDQHGCDWRLKDKGGCNAMHHAINGGNLGIVRFAFAKLGKDLAFEPDDCGWTPLMRAVITSESLDILKFLIGKGADPNDVDRTNSKSILMASILSRKLNFVKFLLEWGADPFYKNMNGKNCYDVARGLGYNQLAKMISQRMQILQPHLKKASSYVLPSNNIFNNNHESSSIEVSDSKSKKTNPTTNQRRSSITRVNSLETPDTLGNIDLNDQEETPDDHFPIHPPETKDSNSISTNVIRRRTVESLKPLKSASSDLEAQYLMRPNAAGKHS